MGCKYVYYVQTSFENDQARYAANVLNPISLVVADSSSQAISYMSSLINQSGYVAQIPTYFDTYCGCCKPIPNLSYYGHGMKSKDFISNPRNMEKYRRLIDIYFPKAQRCRLQIFGERGEIIIHEGKPLLENPDDAASPLIYPVIVKDLSQLDSLEYGSAFLSDIKNASDMQGAIVVARKYTDESDENFIVMQTMLTATGSILVRIEENKIWSNWTQTSSYLQDAPIDNNQYIRRRGDWEPLIVENTVTNNDNPINSAAVKSYVNEKLTAVLKYRRTYSDADFFEGLTVDNENAVVGYVYNYSGPKITIKQPQSNIPYDIDISIVENTLQCSPTDAQIFPIDREVTLLQGDNTCTIKITDVNYTSDPNTVYFDIVEGELLQTSISGVISALDLELDPGDNIVVARIGSHIFLDELAVTVDISGKADKDDVYTKQDVYSKAEICRCIGSYALQPVIQGVTSVFSVALNYPVVYTSYNVIIDGKVVGRDIEANKSFTSASAIFENTGIIIELYNNNVRVMSLTATPSINSNNIVIGYLMLVE